MPVGLGIIPAQAQTKAALARHRPVARSHVAAALGQHGQDMIAKGPLISLGQIAHRHLRGRRAAIGCLRRDRRGAIAQGNHPALAHFGHLRIAGDELHAPGLSRQIAVLVQLQRKKALERLGAAQGAFCREQGEAFGRTGRATEQGPARQEANRHQLGHPSADGIHPRHLSGGYELGVPDALCHSNLRGLRWLDRLRSTAVSSRDFHPK
jgi:hypothetical protein